MFTGIIEEMGLIKSIEKFGQSIRLQIQASKIMQDTQEGDSISVNGCCLTVTTIQSNVWTCHVVQETINRTNIQDLVIGDRVNLERAMRFDGRMGGHFVQGHIDATGTIKDKRDLDDGSGWLMVEAPSTLMQFMIEKGSIAIDGVSLTIAALKNSYFEVAIIPHTRHATTLGIKYIGDRVNLEVDLIAKYLKRLMQHSP